MLKILRLLVGGEIELKGHKMFVNTEGLKPVEVKCGNFNRDITKVQSALNINITSSNKPFK